MFGSGVMVMLCPCPWCFFSHSWSGDDGAALALRYRSLCVPCMQTMHIVKQSCTVAVLGVVSRRLSGPVVSTVD